MTSARRPGAPLPASAPPAGKRARRARAADARREARSAFEGLAPQGHFAAQARRLGLEALPAAAVSPAPTAGEGAPPGAPPPHSPSP